jgi:hypothetical protein
VHALDRLLLDSVGYLDIVSVGWGSCNSFFGGIGGFIDPSLFVTMNPLSRSVVW